MAETDQPPIHVTDTEIDIPKAAQMVLAEVGKVLPFSTVVDVIAGAIAKALRVAFTGALEGLGAAAQLTGEAVHAAEEPFLHVFARFVEPIVAGLFGTELPAGAFDSRANRGARQEAGRGIVDAYMRALAGDGAGPITPSDEGAKRVATAAVNAALEGWFNGLIPELISDLLPEGFGHFTELTKLSEEIISALGVGRLTRRAFAPLVDVTAATPMKWKVNKAFRPQLLSAGQVAKQYARGRWTHDQALEELARDGWSDDRIEALLNDAAKVQGVADVWLLINAKYFDRASGVRYLRNAGYDETTAGLALDIEQIKDIAQFEQQLASAAVDAYAAGRIDSGTLETYTNSATQGDTWGARQRELAGARRVLRRKELTPAEAEAAVKAGILAYVDYRDALARDGYSDQAAAVKELMLRHEVDSKTTLEQHRAAMDAEKAAADTARKTAAATKLAAADAARAAQRRGSVSDLRRAYVRGLIPVSRFEDVLSADYDPDTVQILVDDADVDRATYVAQQQAAAAAGQRATAKGLSLAEISAALFAHVLNLVDVRARLVASGMPTADVDVLVATLNVQLEDRERAAATRAGAGPTAKAKGIDLSRYEQLVRRGVHSLPEYDALLKTLGYDDAARADMSSLLRLQIADDQVATTTRATSSTVDPATGWTVTDWRRAVVLQLRTVDQFATALPTLGFTVPQQQLLLAELRDDVAVADAARARREGQGAAVQGATLPLATVARAAKLGLISPATYEAELRTRGYSDDDVAIELELLTTEIADVQAARAVSDTTPAPAAAKDLALAQLAAAVRRGLRPLADYQALALSSGLTPAAADTVTRVLADELRTSADVKARRDAMNTELGAQNLTLSALEAHVRDGEWPIDEFIAALEESGFTAVDAELLGGILERDVDDQALAL